MDRRARHLQVRPVWRDRRGAVLVELTLVFPVLLILGLGVFEFGNLLWRYHQINTGVRDAARYLARRLDPMAAASDGKQIAVMGEIGGSTQRVPWWKAEDVTVSYSETIDNTGGIYNGEKTIRVLRVATAVTYPGIGFLNVLGIETSVTLRLFHEERVLRDAVE